ncbi:MAG: tetratricopeptide repeat protein, partial [Gammaproteobacteria bacterium]
QDQEYFTDGISEELLNVLARVPDFHVAGRTSSFAFKGEEQDLRKIAEMLGVENILEGSVRKSGDRIRITAQLVKADDGFHLWSETYDRTLDDIFAVQDEIAQAVVVALRATLLGEEPATARMAVTPAGNTEAYDLYLRAKFQMHKRTPESLKRALNYYEQVIEMDPDYAPAWSGLAVAWELSSMYSDVAPDVSHAEAEKAIQRAMELDDQDADTWAALGLLLTDTRQFHEAEAALLKAIELNPNHAMAHNWLGGALAVLDRRRRTEAFKRAFELDPLDLVILSNYVSTMLDSGNTNEARKAAEILEEIHPETGYGASNLGHLAYQEGRLDDAVSWYLKAYRTAPERINNFVLLPHVLVDLNQIELADSWLRQAETLAPNSTSTLWGRHRWHLRQDDLAALEAHARASLEKQPGFPPIVFSVALARMLRGDITSAVELYESKIREPGPEGPGELTIGGFRVVFGSAYAAALMQAGRTAEAMEVTNAAIAELQQQQDQGIRYLLRNSIYRALAANFAVRGERERALAALRQSVADGDRASWWWKAQPVFASLRDDLGFITLVEEVEADVARQRARLEEQGLLLTPEQALTADL